ncbi:tRNA pseudouridine synthase C [Vibrio sp. JCM 19236]|nr:tRNA pseudouridine synthase C [Vibrio sp. JCM 19236]
MEVPYSTGKFPTSRYCLMELSPLTGRKHQLRRHMKHLRHPIVGDTTHGDGKHNRLYREEFGCERLMLHASRLEFEHPFTGMQMVLEARFDDTWKNLIERFEWQDAFTE